MRPFRSALTALVVSAAVVAPAHQVRAQQIPQPVDYEPVGRWGVGHLRTNTGLIVCTALTKSAALQEFSLSLTNDGAELVGAFQIDPRLRLRDREPVAFDIEFEIQRRVQSRRGPLRGAAALAIDGARIVFRIEPSALEAFQRANFVTFRYRGSASRFSMRDSRQALDALKNCAKERFNRRRS